MRRARDHRALARIRNRDRWERRGMLKFLGAATAIIALFSTSSAVAQTFATVPGTYTFEGVSVTIQKGGGPQISCLMSIDFTNHGGSYVTADNVVFTGHNGFCDAGFVFKDTPWLVTVGTNIRLHDVYIKTLVPTGDCNGDIVMYYGMSSAEDLNFETGFWTPSTLPEVSPGSGDCKIYGVISWP
jgi:hypothetical protein